MKFTFIVEGVVFISFFV